MKDREKDIQIELVAVTVFTLYAVSVTCDRERQICTERERQRLRRTEKRTYKLRERDKDINGQRKGHIN